MRSERKSSAYADQDVADLLTLRAWFRERVAWWNRHLADRQTALARRQTSPVPPLDTGKIGV